MALMKGEAAPQFVVLFATGPPISTGTADCPNPAQRLGIDEDPPQTTLTLTSAVTPRIIVNPMGEATLPAKLQGNLESFVTRCL